MLAGAAPKGERRWQQMAAAMASCAKAATGTFKGEHTAYSCAPPAGLVSGMWVPACWLHHTISCCIPVSNAESAC